MRIIAGFIVYLSFAVFAAPSFAVEDRAVIVSSDDAEMNAAIAKARASIGEFWRQLAKPDRGVTELCLKVRIRQGKNSEHFWLRDIARAGGSISGTIADEAEIVTNVKEGDRYTFTEADISDWTYLRNGKIVGNETMLVLLKHLSPEEAAAFREMRETKTPAPVAK